MNEKETFKTLRELQIRIKELQNQQMLLIENDEGNFEYIEQECDELYRMYYETIHNNFDSYLIDEAQNQIGYGKFIDIEFLDALELVINENGKVL